MAATIWVSAGLPTGASLGASPIFSMRSSAEQPHKAAPQQQRRRISDQAVHGSDPSCGRCAGGGSGEAGPVARTVPGAVTMPEIMRKEAGFWTVTVSPTPPSLMARPMAVSSTPGASNCMVTVWPLVTTMGRRTSSARNGFAGVQHAARLHVLDRVDLGRRRRDIRALPVHRGKGEIAVRRWSRRGRYRAPAPRCARRCRRRRGTAHIRQGASSSRARNRICGSWLSASQPRGLLQHLVGRGDRPWNSFHRRAGR